MDLQALKAQAAALDATSEAFQNAMESAPEFLVQPVMQKVEANKKALLEILAEATHNGNADDEELREKQEQITESITKIKAEMDKEPWQNPPALRALRQALDD